MATTFQMTNLISGSPELPKYHHKGVVNEVWKVTLPTTLALADTIGGPVLPANTFLLGVRVDVADLDTGTPAIAFEVGTSTTVGQFIPTGTTTAQAGGIVAATVAGTTGFTSTVDTPMLVTITAAAKTPAKGDMVMHITYTGNP